MYRLFLNSFLVSLLFSFIISTNSYAIEEETVQIIANTIDTNGSIINARDDVLIFSPSYYITAKRAIFDKDKNTLELFENVNISQNNQMVSLSQYAFLDMTNEINKAMPVLLIDKTSKIWINATKIEKKSDLNILNDATISSCECYNPAWSIGFTSGDYNTTDQWINTYNNTLYIKNIPAWYFALPIVPYATMSQLVATYLMLKPPYVGFSTNRNRRTGLLKPKFGYGSEEGWFYIQPIYYAPQDNFDFEYIPQIRTLRGDGHEVTFRYQDSAYSRFDISSGIFREKDSYFKKKNLINNEHYGWDLQYNRTHLFSNSNSSDGLKVTMQNMNDVEYLNTKYNKTTTSTSKLIKSQIKYFYNTNSYYLDMDMQYYNDISKQNNDDVMQVLPKIQLHKYSKSFIFDRLASSIDIKYDRKTRIKGIGANTSNISVPLSYNVHLLNKFLSLSFTEQLNLTNIEYTNVNGYNDGRLLENKHIISADIDLLKPYTSTIHTVHFNSTFTKPNIIKTKGNIYGINSEDSILSLFPVTKSKKNINFNINQSIYNKKDLKSIINHKINQAIVYDANNTSKLANLENELTFFYNYGSLSNRFLYNHDDDMIISSTYSFKFKKDNFFTNIDYSYSKDKTNIPANFSYKDLPDLKSITGHIGNKVLKYYTISYKEQYDIVKKLSNIKEYGLAIDKKCWKLDLKLADNLVAAATNTNRARRQNIVYATITLKPLISVAQVYIQDEREE